MYFILNKKTFHLLHKQHQRCEQPLRCTYIKLDSSLNVDYFTSHFKVKGKTWSMFLFLLIRWNWDPSMSHSIVCHHVVCCGQMNQESRDTLLLIWQCSLTAQTQHMALTTSWHSGPAVDYRPANICLQLFNNFHGHLKSPKHLNRWREGPPLGVSCVVDYQRMSLCFWAADTGTG